MWVAIQAYKRPLPTRGKRERKMCIFLGERERERERERDRKRERFGACMVLGKGGGASSRLEDGVDKLAYEACMK